VPALVARGNLYLDQNAAELSLADFQLALEQDRRNQNALFGIGKAYVLLGGPQQAIKPLTYVIENDDTNAEAYRLRAQAYASVGKNDEADLDIEKSLSINPDDHETYMAQAAILLREEKYPESVEALDKAIQNYKPKDENSKEPFAQGYLTKAAALLEAAKQAPDDEAKTKAYEAALAECDALLEKTPDSPIYAQIRAAAEFRRGVCLRLLGRLGDAVASFTEAINLNPDLAEAFFRRGICFYYMNEDALAVEDFKRAGSIEYQDPRARLWEGFAYAKLGDFHEALRAYGEALAESDRYAPAYVNRGLAYMMLGENDKAVTDFNAAIRLEPAEWTHYFKRGIALERLGKKQQAADSFVNAVRFESNYPPAYRHAADALSTLGHNQLASEYRSKAAELEAKQRQTQQ
jgi:tetratricopeptide (TPR) repeat protein